MVSMSSVVHALWRIGRFALQPLNVSEDKQITTVLFFWLPTLSSSDMLLTDQPSYPSGMSANMRGTKIWNWVTERKIRSGNVITLTTDDLENLPLPSVKLLKMQWFLSRVLALRGAAEFEVMEDGQHYASRFVASQFDAGQFEACNSRDELCCDYEDVERRRRRRRRCWSGRSRRRGEEEAAPLLNAMNQNVSAGVYKMSKMPGRKERCSVILLPIQVVSWRFCGSGQASQPTAMQETSLQYRGVSIPLLFPLFFFICCPGLSMGQCSRREMDVVFNVTSIEVQHSTTGTDTGTRTQSTLVANSEEGFINHVSSNAGRNILGGEGWSEPWKG
jgi:hypothetical protein